MATLSVVTFAMTVPPVYAVQPIRLTGTPDVNLLGLLDHQDPGGLPPTQLAPYWADTLAAQNPSSSLGIPAGIVGIPQGPLDVAADPTLWGDPITQPDKRYALQQLGKLFFWDMQIGGDGVQACASCHFNAGADNRNINQMSPGLRRTAGNAQNLFDGPDGDKTHQLVTDNTLNGASTRPSGPNAILSVEDFTNPAQAPRVGLLVSEDAVISAGGTPDDPVDGTPGFAARLVAVDPGSVIAPDLGFSVDGIAALDVNDAVAPAGPKAVSFAGPYCVDSTGLVATSCDTSAAFDYPAPPAGNGDSPGRQDFGVLDPYVVNRVSGLVTAGDPGFDARQGDTKGVTAGLGSKFFDGFTNNQDAAPASGVDGLASTADDPIPNTVRHVEPRQPQTVFNSIFHFRNFWDGRADTFFNGVNPLGFRDPAVTVPVFVDGMLQFERLNVPFSSAASQAIGPISSFMEMTGHEGNGGRPDHNLGRKMIDATPLLNQTIHCEDPLLGYLAHNLEGNIYTTTCDGIVLTGNVMGITYGDLISDIFDARFTADVCLEADGYSAEATDPNTCNRSTPLGAGASDNRLLIEKNFPIFFGLAVQAYEATLVNRETVVDLINGGIIGFDGTPGPLLPSDGMFRSKPTVIGTGAAAVDVGVPFVVNNNGTPNVPVADQHLTLAQCIQRVAANQGAGNNNKGRGGNGNGGGNAAAAARAEDLCTLMYAQFIPAGAKLGALAADLPFQPPGGFVGNDIGGCNPLLENTNIFSNVTVSGGIYTHSPACNNAQGAILSIDRGTNRFEAGATACAFCHFSANFTGATVAALTLFGAPPPDPFLPPGQLVKIEPGALMERMVKFDGANAVYDSGFYNLAIRPTPEDLGVGSSIFVTPSSGSENGMIPLSLAKLKELITRNGIFPLEDQVFDEGVIADIADTIGRTGLLGLDVNGLDVRGTVPQYPTSMRVGDAAANRGVTNLTPVPFNLTLACGAGLNNGNGNGAGEPNNNPNARCAFDTIIPGEFILRNGAQKAQGLRDVKFTGPFFHNGSKMTIQQVFDFYKNVVNTAPGASSGFPNLNLANLDAGLRIVSLDAADCVPGTANPCPQEAAVIEMMETGLTDWESAHERGVFSHPQLCVAHGHATDTGLSKLVDLHADNDGAVGAGGVTDRITTFQEILDGTPLEHGLNVGCGMDGVATDGDSDIEIPPL